MLENYRFLRFDAIELVFVVGDTVNESKRPIVRGVFGNKRDFADRECV